MEEIAKLTIIEKQCFNTKCNLCDGSLSTKNKHNEFIQRGIDVLFGSCCPNNCAFCIAKSPASIGPHLAWNQKPNKVSITENVLKLIEKDPSIRKHVQVLGGEPLLFMNDLLYFMKALPKSITSRKLQTSLPRLIMNDFDTLIEVLSYFTHIEVAIHHPDVKKHAAILNSNEDHDRFEIMHAIKNRLPNIKVGINTVVTKSISRNDINILLQKAYNSKVDEVRLTEVKECIESWVPLTDLVDIKVKSPYSHGCHVMTSCDKYKGMKIMLAFNCFMCNPKLNASFSDLLKGFYLMLQHKQNKRAHVYSTCILPDGTVINM